METLSYKTEDFPLTKLIHEIEDFLIKIVDATISIQIKLKKKVETFSDKTEDFYPSNV